MAAPLSYVKVVKLCDLLAKNLAITRGYQFLRTHTTFRPCCHLEEKLNHPSAYSPSSYHIPSRGSSFLNKLTSDQIWSSVVATTGKQAKKARGKRPAKKMKKDLNRGQYLGDGQYRMSWPGLNAPVVAKQKTQEIKTMAVNPEKENRKRLLREQWDKKKSRRVPIDQRGWTSASHGGKMIGPPDAKPGQNFEGFDSCIIHMRRVFNMVGTVGRKRSMSALVVTGNRNGAVGFAFGKAPDAMSAIRKAKNKAANNLQYVERYEDHTILHDMESKFHKTRVRMTKQSKGQGLRCHRIIIEICKLAGIKDLYAKVIGAKNPIHITRAVFQGFGGQENFQDIANRKGLNVVEFRQECGSLPILIASPDPEYRRDDVLEEDWDKTMPLEWREELEPVHKVTKKSSFKRPGVVVM